MSTLRADNLSVTLGQIKVLQGASLTLKSGELTAIIGPNGAGKSTLVKAILGLLPHAGEVTFDTHPRAQLDRRARARFASYLPQGQSHAWPIPVRDVVALGRYPHGEAEANAETLAALLRRMGLADLADRPVLDLSGGEQMRVSLARALAVEARFLFADEPLASLDPHYQFSIMQTLRDEADSGTGVVAVLHDLTMAARYADRIVLISKGEIAADGPPESVLTAKHLADIFRVRASQHDIETKWGLRSVSLPDAPEG